jgi:hypothetical protein
MSTSWASNNPTPADLLAPHAKRTIHAFLVNTVTRTIEAESAFWALIYGGTVVDHSTAVAVAHELENSTRKVSEVIAGWKPKALSSDNH